jgi:hypothetical protein
MTMTTTRRHPGEIADPQTRAALRAYLQRVTWRRAYCDLGVADGVIRRILDGQRVRTASLRAVRLGLSMIVAPQREAQP